MRLLPDDRIRRILDRTPEDRDRYADLLRLVAILLVVLGHWSAALVRVQDGQILGTSELLAVVPATRPLTWVFQVMPLFFLTGGSVNLGSWRRAQDRGRAGRSGCGAVPGASWSRCSRCSGSGYPSPSCW